MTDLTSLNGTPVPAKGPDPTYIINVQWFTPDGQGGVVTLDQYTPKLHGRPSAFGPPHTAHCIQQVKEMLAANGVLGVNGFVSMIHRYEVVPSALIDLRGASRN